MATLHDTQKTIKSIEQAGAGEPMAKAIVAAIARSIENLPTKADLQNVAQGLNRPVDATNGRIDTANERIDSLKTFIDARFDKCLKTMTINMALLFYSAVALAAALFALWGRPL